MGFLPCAAQWWLLGLSASTIRSAPGSSRARPRFHPGSGISLPLRSLKVMWKPAWMDIDPSGVPSAA